MAETNEKEVLVVGGDAVLREFYVRALDNLGCSAVCASDAREARGVLIENVGQFGLVLLDLDAPTDEGWELIAHCREESKPSSIPVIVIPGAAIAESDLARLGEACDDVIPKGEFGMTRLNEAVRRLIRRSAIVRPRPDWIWNLES